MSTQVPDLGKNNDPSVKWFAGIIAIIAATNIAIFLDIPILRQLLGIIFLTIIPGLSILFLLKLDKLTLAEKMVLTVGISIAFLMIFGWGLNQASLGVGYKSPLSTGFLTISLSLALAALAVAAYLTNREAFSSSTFGIELNTRSKLCLILPSLFPLLSILGTRIINTSGNNIILMALLFLVPISIILMVLQRHKISQDTYPIAIVMITVSLLSIFWLRSEHALGHDVHFEYYFFQTTLLNQHWSVFEYSTLNSCLSISLLPTVYQSLLDMTAQEQLFKGLYVLICLFTPLAVYIVSRKYLGEVYAFLAALFVSFGGHFLVAPGSPRTNVAIFFFALSIMVLLNSNITTTKRRGLFILFMLATLVSHYATTYIFFFMLLFVALLGLILKRNIPLRGITLTLVGLFCVMIFLWHSQLTEAPFISGISFISKTIRNLGEFFVVEARSTEALTVFGGGRMQENPLLSWIHFIITWFSFILIAVGVIGTLLKRKAMLLRTQPGNPASPPLKARFDIEYLLLAIAGSALLVAMLVLPMISKGYDVQRGYSQAAVVLATFFILGGVMLAQLWRKSPCLLILIVLIPYALFNTGALYELFGFHNKTWLLSEKTSVLRWEFVHEQESLAAKWLSERKDDSSILVFDGRASEKLLSQGVIPRKLIARASTTEYHQETMDKYLYLSHNNVIYGEFYFCEEFFSMSQFREIFTNKSKLYANGGSEIYK